MLNSNALITVDDLLIVLKKYVPTERTRVTLSATEEANIYAFPNNYLVDGTVTVYAESIDISDDITTIDYENGAVTLTGTHTDITADYTYLKFDYADKYSYERTINESSDFVENYLGRKLKRQTYEEEVHIGNDKQILVLRQWPIATVESVKCNDSEIDPSFYSVSDQDAERGFVHKQSGWTQENFLVGYVGEPLAPLRTLKITYTAGFDPVPSDIQGVVISMCAEQIQNQKMGNYGLKEITQGELTYRWLTPSDMSSGSASGSYGTLPGINAKYTSVLNKYRRYIV